MVIKRVEEEGEVKDDAHVLGLVAGWRVVLLLRSSPEKGARALREDTLDVRYSWVIRHKFPIAIGYWVPDQKAN